MIESILPRPGLPPPGSALNADPISGHEWDPSKAAPPNSDLQYACTFPLPAPRVCTEAADCDCFSGDLPAASNPLCQNGNAFTTSQRGAKGYPGLRELQVLQGLVDPEETQPGRRPQHQDPQQELGHHLLAVAELLVLEQFGPDATADRAVTVEADTRRDFRSRLYADRGPDLMPDCYT